MLPAPCEPLDRSPPCPPSSCCRVASGCGDDSARRPGTSSVGARRRPRSPTWSARWGATGRRDADCCSRTPTRTATSRGRATRRAVAGADVIFRSGGEVDEWLGRARRGAGDDARVHALIELASGEATATGPALVAGPAQRDRRRRGDPRRADRGRPDGRPRLRAQRARLHRAAAHASTARSPPASSGFPPAQRKLVTTHDALGYYADRYGIEVVGALIPSLSTQAQPSARRHPGAGRPDRAEDVEAIFPESSLNPKLEEAVSRETGARSAARCGRTRSGPTGSDGATYVELDPGEHRGAGRGLSGGQSLPLPQAGHSPCSVTS